jgi:hypothetical protein
MSLKSLRYFQAELAAKGNEPPRVALHDARRRGARGIETKEGRREPFDSARRARLGVLTVVTSAVTSATPSLHPRNAIILAERDKPGC